MESLFVVDNFSPSLATSLRAEFDRRIGDTVMSFPVAAERFVWDYWNVPNQFTYLRARPHSVLSEGLLAQFKSELLKWAFERLGVIDMSGFWLSAYVEGCQQRPHHDTGNGDWAFVLSLAEAQEGGFQGGETYLAELGSGATRLGEMDERADELEYREIAPAFGRLTVFDARLVHGVRAVKGTHDLRSARLVLQGWLSARRPHVQGGLTAAALASALEERVERLYNDLELEGAVGGKIVLRLQIAPDGSISDGRIVVNSLLRFEDSAPDTNAFADEVLRTARTWQFPASSAPSVLTLPLEFSMAESEIVAA